MNDKSFLGIGWAFPPSFNYNVAQASMALYEDDIRQSLEILLSTTIGERFLQPAYGCNLEPYVFEPMNATIQTTIKLTVTNAIRFYEARIKLESVKLDMANILEGRVDIAIEYTIIITNTRYNFVYPFYIKEANLNG
jgi:uncharacterized protein